MRLERTRRVSEFVDDDYDDSIVWQRRQELHGNTIFKKNHSSTHFYALDYIFPF